MDGQVLVGAQGLTFTVQAGQGSGEAKSGSIMPAISKRVSSIMEGGKSGWEVHFEAVRRKRAGEDIILLSVGDHDFPTPGQSVEACVEALRAGHHHYTDLAGLDRLRAAMAKASTLSTGVETRPEEVIATPGGQGALFSAIHATLDPGQHAIVVGPYYATYPGTFRAAGVEFTVVEAHAEDDFEPRIADLGAALQPNTRVMLINSPNNPTGAVYSEQTIAMIARFCVENDLWLISDEVYWTHVQGEDRHISPLSMPGMPARTLVLNSVSKSHGMTGWRVGWLRGPQEVVETLVGLTIVVTYGLADFVSHGVATAMEQNWGVEEIANTYARRRRLFQKAFDGANGVVMRGSKGGMYAMLDVRSIEPDGEKFAFGLLASEGVGVMPGESFGHAAAGHIRISLVQEERMLEEAILRIRRYIAQRTSVPGQE